MIFCTNTSTKNIYSTLINSRLLNSIINVAHARQSDEEEVEDRPHPRSLSKVEGGQTFEYL
jgi:hypothetical protein